MVLALLLMCHMTLGFGAYDHKEPLQGVIIITNIYLCARNCTKFFAIRWVMVYIVLLSHIRKLVLYEPENGRAGTSLYEIRAGALNLWPRVASC